MSDLHEKAREWLRGQGYGADHRSDVLKYASSLDWQSLQELLADFAAEHNKELAARVRLLAKALREIIDLSDTRQTDGGRVNAMRKRALAALEEKP